MSRSSARTCTISPSYIFFCSVIVLALAVVISPRIPSLFRSQPLLLSALQILDLPPRSFPVTFHASADAVQLETYQRIGFTGAISNRSQADTTAVVLNWSRLSNVIRIVSLLCGPQLDDTIAEVFIWNNNPRPLSHRDFSRAGCPSVKLRIRNSPSNLYFQARFLACAQASTPICFIQDDDYLVLPEIIQSMRSRFGDTKFQVKGAPSLHLLPPHEHLTSQLRTLHIPSQNIQTSFAWLGHGAMLHRSEAADFLALLQYLDATDAEMKMADNYFTILANRFPETWFDHGIELGGGQPFTVGTEGDARNKRHIDSAVQYLSEITKSSAFTGNAALRPLPFVSKVANVPDNVFRAPCLGASCRLETTISLLPEFIPNSKDDVGLILGMEERKLEFLGEKRRQQYLDFPPSLAVDGRPETAFRSPEGARRGDIISLKLHPQSSSDWTRVEMVWLVDSETAEILRSSAFESSGDNQRWTPSPEKMSCSEIAIDSLERSPESGARQRLECSVQMLPDGVPFENQFFRVHLEEDRAERWSVYEVWMRGIPI